MRVPCERSPTTPLPTGVDRPSAGFGLGGRCTCTWNDHDIWDGNAERAAAASAASGASGAIQLARDRAEDEARRLRALAAQPLAVVLLQRAGQVVQHQAQ